ncbi:hypothetical protein [Lentilactobacillus sp. Marseille-Q4993]|uniref:DUF7679 family protein n=1 Tax=Lentilactobacillus sp. Marseille-Q4993 TaxID=3039492 RepID=UPI0024BC97D2|nr:hypothetical protein [Lentilactobacillus sp. Marseille-Q4993]
MSKPVYFAKIEIPGANGRLETLKFSSDIQKALSLDNDPNRWVNALRESLIIIPNGEYYRNRQPLMRVGKIKKVIITRGKGTRQKFPRYNRTTRSQFVLKENWQQDDKRKQL